MKKLQLFVGQIYVLAVVAFNALGKGQRAFEGAPEISIGNPTVVGLPHPRDAGALVVRAAQPGCTIVSFAGNVERGGELKREVFAFEITVVEQPRDTLAGFEGEASDLLELFESQPSEQIAPERTSTEPDAEETENASLKAENARLREDLLAARSPEESQPNAATGADLSDANAPIIELNAPQPSQTETTADAPVV